MRNWTKFLAGLVAGGFVLSATAALADEIRVGITMRMVSENGQKYGQMVMDEIGLINEAGGINGHQIKATLMNDECKSDKGVANANKLIFQEKVHLLIGSTCSSVSNIKPSDFSFVNLPTYAPSMNDDAYHSTLK